MTQNNQDRLLTVPEAVFYYGSRLPFLRDEDKAWRAIRDKHIPSVKIGRRVYLSTAKLEALCRGET